MKLHLPVKLRASLIAAVIAVTASVYNARAVDYEAPSDTYGWKTNDITLTELYNKLAGNTYTATATTFAQYEFYTEEGKEAVRVGYLGDPKDASSQKLEWNTFRNQYYWVETVTNADGTTSDVEHYIAPDEVETLVTYNKLGDIVDDADIIIAAKGQTGDVISYTDGKTKLEAEDKIEFQNSVASGVNSVDPGNVKEFIGDQTFIAEKLVINDANSNGRGSEVVLEDATIIGVKSTEIGDHSRLTVLDGDTSSLTDEEKTTLDIQKISSTATTNWDDANSVKLGDVSGLGSLAIIGGKERSENTVEEGVITEHAYDKAVGKDDKLTTTIESIAGTGSTDFGNIAIANADVTVESGIKNANTLGLVNSVTTVNAKGVTAFGMDVNAESSLLVKHGDIRNTTNQGAGHVDILGKVVAEDGNIGFSNSKHSAGAGIYEGAHVEASKDVLLSNVDTTKAAHLSAGDNLTVTTKSTITDSLNVSAGDDLSLSDGSTISGSKVTVGDDIVVSDGLYGASHLAGTTITVTGQGDDVDAAVQKVTLKNGATMTDSHIVGGNGDILLDGSKQDSNGQNMTVVVGLGADAAEGTTTDFLNTAEAQKGNLAAVLGAAEGSTPLTSAALEAAGMKVGSSIEHTAGNITIKDATVSSTLLTADGNVAIGDPDETGKPGHAGTSAEGPACETIETVLTAIKGGVLADTDLDAAAKNFPTQVEGSLIDVRDGADSSLSIDAAAVSNTIILGINGNIHAEDALVNNNYIDGGAGLDIQHSAVIDTDIVNLTADIKISGDSAIVGTNPDKKVVLTTQGTADFTDKDSYTGGSIILSDVAMENVAIKSGVKTTVNADGTYTHTPVDETTTEVGTSTIPGGVVDGSLAGVTLPYGEIDIDDSSLKAMEITTAKGNVNIDGTTLLDSVVETGVGNIDIVDQSGVGSTTITSKGAGNITVDTSKVSGSAITAAGAGNISITNSEVGEGVSVIAGDATAHVFDTVIKTGGAGNIDIANSSVTNTEVATGGDGNISISDATLLDSTATTAGAGDITITTSSISVSDNTAESTLPKATVSTGGQGNILITANSDLDDTDVTTGGEGHIEIADSTVHRGDISTNGQGANDYIAIVNSTLEDANVTTQGAGDIVITTSSISVSDNSDTSAMPKATISVAGAGNIEITASSDLDDTNVTTGGDGNIIIDNSAVTNGTVSTAGDGYIAITSDSDVDKATISTEGDGAIYINHSDVDDSLVRNNGTGDITIMNEAHVGTSTVSTQDGNISIIANSEVISSAVTSAKEGNITIHDSLVQDSTVHNDHENGGLGDIEILQSHIINSSVQTGEGNIQIGTPSTGTPMVAWNAPKDADAPEVDTLVEGSVITTTKGGLTIDESYVDSLTATDADGATTYTKTTIKATDDSVITGSAVSGSDITISEGDLLIRSHSAITGDVNLLVEKGTITVNDNDQYATQFDLDGDRVAPGTRDASIVAKELDLRFMKDWSGSLSNGQIAVSDETRIQAGETFSLINVNNAEGEAPGTLGDLVEYNGDSSNATLNVKGGSIVEANEIYARNTDADQTPANIHNYFGNVNVGEDSLVTVSDTAKIENYTEGTLAGADTEGSKVTFEKDAHLTNATIQGTGEYEGDAVGSKGTVTSVLEDGHIGNLNITNGGVLSLNAGAQPDASTHSYISNIGDSDGTLNVINQVLSTPELDHADLSLGLNGGTVVLEGVAAADGATIASTKDVNAHVSLLEITNASKAGAPDVTPYGQSTIKTNLTVLDRQYSSTVGDAVTNTGKQLYYAVNADHALTGTETYTVYDPATGTTSELSAANGDTLKAGQIVVKVDTVVSDSIKLADGTTYNKAVTVDTVGASTLTATEQGYLQRVTVPVLDENGNLQFQPIDGTNEGTLLVGQKYTTYDIITHPDATETGAVTSDQTNGIASLTVAENMDSDNTYIRAYEVVEKDVNGNIIVNNGVVSTDPNSGLITINGVVSGQDNQLIADKDITIGGIVTNETDGADYSNHNTVTSMRGDIAIGDQGIVGSDNSLTAHEGSITVTGDIEGHNNTLTADGDITTANITGNANVLYSEKGDIWTEDITGDSNDLHAVAGDIWTENITGDTNVLLAGKSVTVVGALKGDSNSLTAEDGDVYIIDGVLADADDASSDSNIISSTNGDISLGETDGDSLVGSDNVLTATTGDIFVMGDIEGDNNTLTATTDGTTGGDIMTDDITGDDNKLTADKAIWTENITGDTNVLVAGTTIDTADITGNSNDLDAVEKITVDGTITGDLNTLTSATDAIEVTGSIVGNSNDLDAVQDITIGANIEGDSNTLTTTEGAIAVTGSIVGDLNDLDAKQDITIGGDIVGDDNMLTTTEGDIAVTGSIVGEGNDLQAHKGTITVDGNVMGENPANPNALTAAETITIGGTLGGVGTQLTAYASGLSQDDVAISIGVFAAQGTDLTIATTSSPIYGTTNGNGAIVIGSMDAAVNADGSLADVDAALVNSIVSNNSYVQVGGMQGSNAYTTITAAKDVLIGTAGAGAEDDGANLTISAKNLVVNSDKGLTLTDSSVNVTGSITGTSLTLTTTGTTEFASTAHSVTLEGLTVGGSASLTAGSVVVDNLTIDGKSATIDSTNLTVNESLTIQNGADAWLNRVTVPVITIDSSSLTTSSINGLESLYVENGSQVSITQGLTLKDTDPNDGIVGGELGVTGGSVLSVTGAIDVEGAITAGDATGAGTITTASTIKGGSIAASNGATISGTAGIESTDSISVDKALLTTSGTVKAVSTMDVTNGGAVTGKNIDVEGALTVTGGDVTAQGGSISAASASITGGELSATKGVAVDGDITATADANGVRSMILADITSAQNVTITESDVTGKVNLMGTLAVTDGSVGNVMGANKVQLSHATTGSITMAKSRALSDRDVVAEDDSIINGDITGANNITLTDSTVEGSLVNMTGALSMTNSSARHASGATSATLDDATIGTLSLSGDDADVTATNGSEIVTITGANDVTLTDSSVASTIGMSGALAVTNGSTGNVTGATSATLDKATTGALSLSGDDADVTATNASSIASITGANDVTLDASTVAGAVDMSGNLEATNGASMATVSGAKDVTLTDSSVAGSIGMSGALAVINGSTGDVTGATSATIDTATTGALSLSGDDADVTATNGSEIVTITGANDVTLTDSAVTGSVGMDGALSVTNGTAGDVTGATSATLDKGTTGALNLAGDNADVTATNSSSIASITGANDVTLDASTVAGAVDMSGNLEATNGASMATVSGAKDVTLTDSSVASTIGMSGALAVTNGSTGNVTGATSATLDKGTTGALNLAGDNADVTATNSSSIASITGANDVTLDASTVAGAVDMSGNLEATNGASMATVSGAKDVTLTDSSVASTIGMSGALAVTNGSTGDVTGATSATLDKATTGALSLSGDDADVTAINSSSIASITGANDVTLDASSVAGSIGMSGDLQVTAGTIGSVSGAKDVTLTNVSSAGSIGMTGALTADNAQMGAVSGATSAELTNGSSADSLAMNNGAVTLANATVNGVVTGATDVTAEHSDILGDVTMNGELELTDGEIASINAASTVTAATVTDAAIGSGLTVQNAALVSGSTIGGALKAGSADVSNASTIKGNLTTTAGDATISGASKVEGTVSATGGNASVDASTVSGDLISTTGTVAATNGAAITGNVSGATGATVTDSTVGGTVSTNTGLASVSGSTTGAVSGDSVEIVDGIVTSGGVTADNGSVSITGGSEITGNVSGTTGATVADSTVDGTVSTDTGLASVSGSTTGAVSGDSVSINGGTVGGNATADNGSVAITGGATVMGDVSGTTGAVVNNSTVDGSLKTSGGDAILTEATVAGAVEATTGNATIIGGEVGSVVAGSDAVLDGVVVTNGVTGDTVDISGGTVGGNVHATTDATISEAEVAGTVTSSGTVSITGGTVGSDVTKDMVAVSGTTVQLEETSITGNVETSEDLISIGDVNVAGSVEVGKDLYVNSGTLAATGTVNVEGSTKLSNGEVDAADFISKGGVELVNMSGTVKSLTVETGLLSISGQDSLIVEGLTDVQDGKTLVVGGSLSGDRLQSKGLDVRAGGIVTMANGSDLGGSGLRLDNGTVNSNVTNAGEVSMINTSTVNGNIEGASDVTITDSSVAGSIGMSGALAVTNGSTGDVTGATSATLDKATTGALSLSGDDADVTATNGSTIASITGANDVTLTDSAVAGSIGMTGALTADNAQMGAVSGATSAELTNGSSADSLAMNNGAVTLANATVNGVVTGAADVTAEHSDILGDVTMNGELELTDGEIASINAASTVTAATVTDAAIGSGLTVQNAALVSGSTIGGALEAGSADVSNASTIKGNLTTTAGDATISGASKVEGTVSATGGNASVDASTVGGDLISTTGAVAATNGAAITGNVSGATGATVTDSTVGGTVSTNTGLASVSGSTTGAVSGDSVSINGGTVGGNATADNGSVAITGGATVMGDVFATNGAVVNNSTVDGSLTTSGGDAILTEATVAGAVEATTGNATIIGGEADSVTAGQKADLSGVVVTNGVTGDTVEITDASSVGGSVVATNGAVVNNSTVDGSLTTSGGDAILTEATVAGAVEATTGNATIIGGEADSVTAGQKADLSGVVVTNGVTGDTVEITDASSVGGSVVATNGAVVNDSTVTGTVSTDTGLASVSGSTTGAVSGDSVEIVDGIVTSGGVTADNGSVSISGGSEITGDVSGTTGVVLSGSSVDGSVSASGTDALVSVTGGSVTGSVKADQVKLTETQIDTDVNAGSLVTNGDVNVGGAVNAGSLTVNNGDLTAGGVVTVTGNSVLNGGSVLAKDFITGGLLIDGSDATFDSVISSDDLTLIGNKVTVKGDTLVEGMTTLTGAELTGGDTSKLTTDGLTATGGSTVTMPGGLDLNNAGLTLDNSTVNGNVIEAGTVNMTGGSEVNGNIADAKDVTLTDSAVTGSVGMDGALSVTNGSAGDVTGATSATLDKGTTGALSLAGDNADVTATNGSDIASITGANDVTLTDSSVTGSVGMDGALSVTNGSAGDVTGATSATLDKGTTGALSLAGDNADVTATNGSDIASITGANDVTLSNATVGAVEMTGDLMAENGSVIEGNVTGANNVTLKDNTTAHDITLTGKLTASEHTSMGAVKAGSTEILGDALGTSLETGDLTVKAGKTYATTGDVVADGKVDIQGAVTSKEGNVSLTGTTGSSIAAPVEATTGKVTLGGEIAVTDDVTAGKELTIAEGAAITATGAALTGDTVDVKGTLTAEDTTLTGVNGVSVAGTLNAGEGTVIDGTLTGAGTINKTGGDALELAGDTQLTGDLNVSDESTLSVEDGAKLGDVSLTGASTIEVVAAKGENTGEVEASSITLSKDSTMKSDLDLAAQAVDKVTADKHNYNGATLELATVEPGHEAGIDDQTRITVAEGNIVSSVNEDIVHDLDTLNAHAENMGDRIDIVLSKNYKGADKTENQAQVANGVASLNAEAVKGTELEKVLDALAHTRSEADAVAALDSLGGMGYAGMQKLIADDAHEHLQTLRSTLDSVSADVRRRFDANGQRIEGVQSSAIAAVVTGGASEVGGNGNCGDYTRSSFGAMIAGAHAVSNEWTFGADLAYSYVDGDCSEATFTGDAIYFDIAMMQKRGRFSQTGTIGAGLYRFDTERDVRVSAKGHDYSGHAEGSTNAAAINLSYEASYDLIRTDDGHAFSSLVMAEASFVQIDGMEEEGMGNAGLRTEFDDMASITLGLGGRYSYSFGKESNPGYFAVEAMLVVDAGDDTPKVQNQFIGGGETFNLAGPEAGDIGLRLNAGLLIPVGEQWGVFGNVTSEFRSEQSSVGGGVGVKYSF